MKADELFVISPRDEAEAWAILPGSSIRRVIHNHIACQIKVDVGHLKTCKPEDLSSIQARVKAREDLIAFLSRKDTTEK